MLGEIHDECDLSTAFPHMGFFHYKGFVKCPLSRKLPLDPGSSNREWFRPSVTSTFSSSHWIRNTGFLICSYNCALQQKLPFHLRSECHTCEHVIQRIAPAIAQFRFLGQCQSNLKDLESFGLSVIYLSSTFPELDAHCKVSLWKAHFPTVWWVRETIATSLASFICFSVYKIKVLHY